MLKHFLLVLSLITLLVSCEQQLQHTAKDDNTTCEYLQYTTNDAVQAGGIHMVKLKEGYQVWTKRIGNNPTMKVLLLHGGPAGTHELMIAFESFSRRPISKCTSTTSWARTTATSPTI